MHLRRYKLMITGAGLFVKALKAEHVNTVFAYPGGQAIDMFDALYGEDTIELIIPRHEQGLIHAADGYARSTGNVGVCLVTSGPGAANLVTGIATANYDSVPLVCFTGQVPRWLLGKDAFQEVDIVSMTSSVCKYAVTVKKREDLGAAIQKAFHIARTGKPGVAVVDLPKDIQRELGDSRYDQGHAACSLRSECPISEELADKAMTLLSRAQRPLFLIGGGVHISRAEKDMQHLAEITGVPAVTTIMGRGSIPTTHGLYAGNLGIHGSYAANMAVSSCDVLFSIGTRFNDRITGRPEEFAPNASIIHVDIDSSVISRNIPADLPILADAGSAIRAFTRRAVNLPLENWIRQIRTWQKEHPLVMKGNGITPEKIIRTINSTFQKLIIATDVGQNQLWAAQYLELNDKKKMLTSGGLGTMGYGLPAAVGARIGNPDTRVVLITGDGGLQMNIQEMATAVAYELPLVICVLNNGYLGNVRQWQEMFFGKRYSGTCMRYRKSCPSACSAPSEHCPVYTPDFIKLAESYGAKGIRVTREEEILPALTEAGRSTAAPVLIEFIIEREENVLPIVPPGNALDDMIVYPG